MIEGLIDDEQGGFREGREVRRSDLHTKWIGEKERDKKLNVLGFIDLEKTYDKVNREALWLVLRMYDVEDILLNGIKNMYVDSSACIRVK